MLIYCIILWSSLSLPFPNIDLQTSSGAAFVLIPVPFCRQCLPLASESNCAVCWSYFSVSVYIAVSIFKVNMRWEEAVNWYIGPSREERCRCGTWWCPLEGTMWLKIGRKEVKPVFTQFVSISLTVVVRIFQCLAWCGGT